MKHNKNQTNSKASIIMAQLATLLFLSSLVVTPLFAQKSSKMDYYSSKHYIEGAYPYVTCADWTSVAAAYKKVGKNEQAKLAESFAERLKKLEGTWK